MRSRACRTAVFPPTAQGVLLVKDAAAHVAEVSLRLLANAAKRPFTDPSLGKFWPNLSSVSMRILASRAPPSYAAGPRRGETDVFPVIDLLGNDRSWTRRRRARTFLNALLRLMANHSLCRGESCCAPVNSSSRVRPSIFAQLFGRSFGRTCRLLVQETQYYSSISCGVFLDAGSSAASARRRGARSTPFLPIGLNCRPSACDYTR